MRYTMLLLAVLVAACKGESELEGPPVGAVQKKAEAPAASPAVASVSPDAPISAVAPATAAGATAAPAPPAAGKIPADGKYENVMVEGVTRPMIQVMNGGDVVLVDVDGAKPRTWEEQFKRKGDLPRGYFDLHKTDVNKNNKFDDDPVDRQGRWRMDEKGAITRE